MKLIKSQGGCYDTVKRKLISKHFQFKQCEANIYQTCLQAKQFNPDFNQNKTYYIPMPPPNITGKLHLGHATFLTIQDFLARFYRKNQYCTLLLPGIDHAGLATHQKILELLPDSENYTPKEYFKAANKIKSKHHKIISSQMMRMGASCDWDREQYTLSDNFIHASTEALRRLHKENLLYSKDGNWYISMKGFADELLEEINSSYFTINDHGSLNELIYMLKNIEDWCISRQIPWGAQMPIYTNKSSGERLILSKEEYNSRSEYEKEDLIQETACFDTWFTSSLYPFASLGWPENTHDFNRFYPANIIETGADILFFWCARMLMMGKFLTGKYPFKEIYLHGMCRDNQGRKMSKSLGNGIDPLDIIDKYGADALRFTILSKTTYKDLKLDESDFLDSFKFINKIWQSARFFQIHFEKQSFPYGINKDGDFYEKMEKIKATFLKDAENRAFIDLTRNLQWSFKHEFCDLWIEDHKKDFYNADLNIMNHGIYILSEFLNLFNCLIPFCTEEIFTSFFNDSLTLKPINP